MKRILIAVGVVVLPQSYLIAALRPEAFTRYFLAEYQRKALSGQLKFVSAFGWVFLSGSVLLFIALTFQSELNFLTPIVGPLLFLVCAAAYLWWGIRLVRSPDSFLKRATGPLSRFAGLGCKGVWLNAAGEAQAYDIAC